MNWQDERIGLQIERALAHVRLTQNCQVEIFVCKGQIQLIAQLHQDGELDSILYALGTIPGVRSIEIDVAIKTPIFLSKNRQRHGQEEQGFGTSEDLN